MPYEDVSNRRYVLVCPNSQYISPSHSLEATRALQSRLDEDIRSCSHTHFVIAEEHAKMLRDVWDRDRLIAELATYEREEME